MLVKKSKIRLIKQYQIIIHTSKKCQITDTLCLYKDNCNIINTFSFAQPSKSTHNKICLLFFRFAKNTENFGI